MGMERLSILGATNQNLDKACLATMSFGQPKVLHPSSASPFPMSRQRYFDGNNESDHVDFVINGVKNAQR